MLGLSISGFQGNGCQCPPFCIAFFADSIDTLQAANFASGKLLRTVSSPYVTVIKKHIGNAAFRIKLFVLRARQDNCVVIHKDDFDLPLTFVPETFQAYISGDKRFTSGIPSET